LLAAPWAVVTLTAATSAQTPGDERQIRVARERSNRAIAAHDVAAMAREWTEDVHVVSSTGAETAGRERNQARVAEQFARRPDIVWVRRPATIDVYAAWDVASERGQWTGRWTEPDGTLEIGGTYLAQWRKVDGSWRIRAELFVPTRCKGAAYCQKRP
jgi:ketosteroid isomerase-like protein